MAPFDLLFHRQHDAVLDRSYQTLSDLIDGKRSSEMDPDEYAGHARVTAQVVSAWHRFVNEQIAEVETLQRSVTQMAAQLTESLLNVQMLEAELAALGRSQALISFDLNGDVLDANENFCESMGYSTEEIRGQHHSLFVDPVSRTSTAYRAFWGRLAAGLSESGRYKRLAKGGREVWVQATYNPVLDARGRTCKVLASVTFLDAELDGALDSQTLETVSDQVVGAGTHALLGVAAHGLGAAQIALDALAQGPLDQAIRADLAGTLADLNQSCRGTAGKLRLVISEVRSCA